MKRPSAQRGRTNPIKPNVTFRRGHWYYRIRMPKGSKPAERFIALPGDPDTPEFDRKYWEIRSGRSPELRKPSAYTWQALIEQYRASVRFRKLTEGTQRSYARTLDRILEKNAERDARELTRAQVRAIHQKYADTPRQADRYVQTISILLNFAADELDWPGITNVAKGIELYGTQREFTPWPTWLQDAFAKAAEALGKSNVRIGLELGIATGQRAGDLCAMEWDHYDGDYIAVLPDKSQEREEDRIWIYCTPRLRAFLDQLPRRGRFIIAKNLAEPVGYDALEKEFRAVRDALGAKAKPFVMHGWRYTAAVELAEAGCSDAEIQAVTGHKTLAMVGKYRARARQKKLSRAGQERRERQEKG